MYFQPDLPLLEEILHSPQNGIAKLIDALNSNRVSTLSLNNLLLPYPIEQKKALLHAVATAVKSTQATALDISGNALTGAMIAAFISDIKGSALTKIHIGFNALKDEDMPLIIRALQESNIEEIIGMNDNFINFMSEEIIQLIARVETYSPETIALLYKNISPEKIKIALQNQIPTIVARMQATHQQAFSDLHNEQVVLEALPHISIETTQMPSTSQAFSFTPSFSQSSGAPVSNPSFKELIEMTLSVLENLTHDPRAVNMGFGILETMAAFSPETVTEMFSELYSKIAQKLANTDAQDIPDKLSECASAWSEVFVKIFPSEYQEMISRIKPQFKSALEESLEKTSAQETFKLQDASQSKLASLFKPEQEKICLLFALAHSFYPRIMEKGGQPFLQEEIKGIKEKWTIKLNTCLDGNQLSQETQERIETALAKNKLANAHKNHGEVLPDCTLLPKNQDLFTAYRSSKRRRDSSDSDSSNDELSNPKAKRFAPINK